MQRSYPEKLRLDYADFYNAQVGFGRAVHNYLASKYGEVFRGSNLSFPSPLKEEIAQIWSLSG